MDLRQHLTLDELRAQAPRSFDKVLVDLIADAQYGRRTIVTPDAPPALPADAANLMLDMANTIAAQRTQIMRLEQMVVTLADRVDAISALEIDSRLIKGAA
mgnify:CR=1 FL=1